MTSIEKLLEVMRALRDPENGCPWDLEQDFSTIAPYTIEEAYEVADAIERKDWDELRHELGDLLFQVVFYAQMGKEHGYFDFEEIAAGIADKMTRRHPHVFGDVEERDSQGVRGRWEDIKEAERAGKEDGSVLADIALALPALKRAQKLGNRASRVGFDWPHRKGVRDKIREEFDELEGAIGTRDQDDIEEELGDLIFSLVNLARHLDVNAEKALMRANAKFERRFRHMESAIAADRKDMRKLNLEELEHRWHRAKRQSDQKKK